MTATRYRAFMSAGGAGTSGEGATVALPLSRVGLIGAELGELAMMWSISVGWFLPIAIVAVPSAWMTWLLIAAACAVVLGAFGSGSAAVTWLRGRPPVTLDAHGIDLRSSGPVPWEAIEEVRFEAGTLLLTLACTTPPAVERQWFTWAHSNMTEFGEINVPLGWTSITPTEIAAQILRFKGPDVGLRVLPCAGDRRTPRLDPV